LAVHAPLRFSHGRPKPFRILLRRAPCLHYISTALAVFTAIGDHVVSASDYPIGKTQHQDTKTSSLAIFTLETAIRLSGAVACAIIKSR
jgi:hypothetical protein